MIATVKFNNSLQKEFSTTLKQRVDDFFKANHRSKYGGFRMLVKIIIFTTLYFGGYALIMTDMYNVFVMWAITAVMGIAAAGIGMSYMHDANHNSLSKNKRLNKIVSFSADMLGVSSLNWRIQHNILHHTYTNIENLDEDINSRPLYRFTKGAKHYKFHKFQHIYMFFLYGLMTLIWSISADFPQLKRFKDEGLLGKKKNYKAEVAKLLMSKIIYFAYVLVLPFIFVDVTWWQVLIGFFTMHYFTGLILALTFQLAHLVEKTEFPEPVDGRINENWQVHQLKTTADFAQKNKLLTWYIGGLNYQVEHHLFPHISHVHYPSISKIVKQTTDEFGIRYNVYKTFGEAVKSHIKILKQLGKAPETV